ncbi:DUF5631 domain-containing protein [Mycobacterium sp. 852002-51057_SCH5723018]|uniref:DUF5631 domain-containing protein n=1 Tax=Mycobacterium sp. 852002-51057_SCH5723018 TaxID=1834094 RepID=UPI00351018E8
MTGGLWPAELSTVTAETATLAEYLRADLQRITRSANDELKMIKLAGMPDVVRQAEEARVIDEARALAVRRVESTMRQLDAVKAAARAEHLRPPDSESQAVADLDATQIIPAVEPVEPLADAPTESVALPEEVLDHERNHAPVADAVAGPVVAEEREPETPEGRHRAGDAENTDDVAFPEALQAVEPAVASESDEERLWRLLAFVVRQEPRVNWAIADRNDGTTILVTDLAHGWIPSDIALPAGVRLLEPERRSGKVSALVGASTRIVTYAPGDSLGWLDDFAGATASVQPRELPPVADVGWELSQATHWRDGLPRMVHTLARAAAAGTGVAEEEIDLLRVHRDTARYQLLMQYPNVNTALLLNCLLLAATEGAVTGDSTSANYHLAWFQKLSGAAASP